MALGIFIGFALYGLADLGLDLMISKKGEVSQTPRPRHFLKRVPDRQIHLGGQVVAQQFVGTQHVIVVNPN